MTTKDKNNSLQILCLNKIVFFNPFDFDFQQNLTWNCQELKVNDNFLFLISLRLKYNVTNLVTKSSTSSLYFIFLRGIKILHDI